MAIPKPVEFDWKDRPAKRYARMAVCGEIEKAKCVLLLPGKDLSDYELLRNTGVVGKKTFALFAEWQTEAAKEIRTRMRERHPGQKYYLHTADLDEFSLKPLLGKQLIDFAYLDYCGPLTAAHCRWLVQILNPVLRVGSVLSITIGRCCRTPEAKCGVRQCLAYLNKHHRHLMRQHNQEWPRHIGSNVSLGLITLLSALLSNARVTQCVEYREDGSGYAMTSLQFKIERVAKPVAAATRDHLFKLLKIGD